MPRRRVRSTCSFPIPLCATLDGARHLWADSAAVGQNMGIPLVHYLLGPFTCEHHWRIGSTGYKCKYSCFGKVRPKDAQNNYMFNDACAWKPGMQLHEYLWFSCRRSTLGYNRQFKSSALAPSTLHYRRQELLYAFRVQLFLWV